MNAIIAFLLICLIIWFWLDSARAREIATGICIVACHQRDVQFLDQTVGIIRIGMRWTTEGVRLRRTFRFDYSDQGMERRSGHIILTGTEMEEFSLGLV
jgi:hypothetical protein